MYEKGQNWHESWERGERKIYRGLSGRRDREISGQREREI